MEVILLNTDDTESDDKLSTEAAVTLSVLVTFIVTLIATALIFVILSTTMRLMRMTRQTTAGSRRIVSSF